MKPKTYHPFPIVITFLLASFHLILAIFISSILPKNDQLFNTLAGIIFAFLLLLYLTFIIIGALKKNYPYNIMQPKHMENDAYRAKKRASLKRLSFWFGFYYIFNVIMITVLIALFSYIFMTTEDNQSLAYLIVFTFLMLWFFIHAMYQFLFPKQSTLPVDEERATYIYAILNDVLKQLNIKKTVYLDILNDQSLFILIHKKSVHFILGIENLIYLSDDELKAFIFEQFSYELSAQQSGLNFSYQMISYINSLNNRKAPLRQLFYSLFFPITHAVRKNQYVIFPLIQIEMNMFLDHHPYYQKHMSLFLQQQSKRFMKHIFSLNPFASFLQVKSENNYFFESNFELFMKFYQEKRMILNDMALQAITDYPSLFPSASTLLKAHNLTDYAVIFDPIETRNSELLHIIRQMDDMFDRYMSEQEIPTSSRSGIENALTVFAENTNELACLNVINEAKMISDYDTYLDMIRFLKQNKPTLAKSFFELGYAKTTILLDPTGIDELYQAIKMNDRYIIEALPLIQATILNFGLVEEYDQYLEQAKNLYHFYETDYQKGSILTINDRLIDAKISPETLDKFISFIKHFEAIDAVYMGTKVIDKSYDTVVVGIHLTTTNPHEIQSIMSEIFDYLDMLEDQYTLILIHHKLLLKPFNKLKSSLKYTRS